MVQNAGVLRWLLLPTCSVALVSADSRSVVAERVMMLTRDSAWTRVMAVPVAFTTWHPQGMVKIGDSLFVSSVEVHDRNTGKGVGHLFKIDLTGHLLHDLKLGEGAIYHPGGIDFDGSTSGSLSPNIGPTADRSSTSSTRTR